MRLFDVNKDQLSFPFDYNNEETSSLRESFKDSKKTITIDDLRRVALWKLNRVLEVPEELLKDLNDLRETKDLDFKDENVKKVISDLISCKGVGLPMASTILKFLRPDIFPIIDVRAYRVLFGKKIYSSQYSIELYYGYIEKIYLIRDKLKIELSKVDEQLYEFDKKYNGKI